MLKNNYLNLTIIFIVLVSIFDFPAKNTRTLWVVNAAQTMINHMTGV